MKSLRAFALHLGLALGLLSTGEMLAVTGHLHQESKTHRIETQAPQATHSFTSLKPTHETSPCSLCASIQSVRGSILTSAQTSLNPYSDSLEHWVLQNQALKRRPTLAYRAQAPPLMSELKCELSSLDFHS